MRAIVAAALLDSRLREVALRVTPIGSICCASVWSTAVAAFRWPGCGGPKERYWQAVEQALTTVAGVIPARLPIIVVADRAYDVPAFVDAVIGQGWSWVVRVKAGSDLTLRDQREQRLRTLVQRQLARPGRRWQQRRLVCKRAGWRRATVVGVWATGHAEPLVLLTDRRPRMAVVTLYRQRCWIEPGFRQDKTAGWQWEAGQARALAHQERLILALAWATLRHVAR